MSNGGCVAAAEAVGLVVCDAGPLIHLDQLGCLSLLGDFDFLQKCFEGFVGFIANVCGVNAAVLGCAAGHRDKFGGVAVAADFVLEATGQADSSFIHGLPGELRHFFDFRGCGYSFEVFSHDLFADGGVTGKHGYVERGGIFAALIDPIFYGPGGIAVGAFGSFLGVRRFLTT